MSRTPVMVLNRIDPRPECVQRLREGLEEWFVFIAKQKGFVSLDQICWTDKQVAWIEEWASKADLDAFNEAHLHYSNFLSMTIECCRGMPKRNAFQRI